MPDNNGGWTEYGALVLKELERLNNSMETLKQDVHSLQKSWGEDLNAVRKEGSDEVKEVRAELERVNRQLSVKIGQLQIKSGVWGLVGGLVPVLIAVAIAFLK